MQACARTGLKLLSNQIAARCCRRTCGRISNDSAFSRPGALLPALPGLPSRRMPPASPFAARLSSWSDLHFLFCFLRYFQSPCSSGTCKSVQFMHTKYNLGPAVALKTFAICVQRTHATVAIEASSRLNSYTYPMRYKASALHLGNVKPQHCNLTIASTSILRWQL